jgi:hypothetical protein
MVEPSEPSVCGLLEIAAVKKRFTGSKLFRIPLVGTLFSAVLAVFLILRAAQIFWPIAALALLWTTSFLARVRPPKKGKHRRTYSVLRID